MWTCWFCARLATTILGEPSEPLHLAISCPRHDHSSVGTSMQGTSTKQTGINTRANCCGMMEIDLKKREEKAGLVNPPASASWSSIIPLHHNMHLDIVGVRYHANFFSRRTKPHPNSNHCVCRQPGRPRDRVGGHEGEHQHSRA